MAYDIMMIFKSKEGVPLAAYAKGHYMGNIQHISKGSFTIHKQINLPPNCCILECEGFQKAYGKAIDQEGFGLIGLDD